MEKRPSYQFGHTQSPLPSNEGLLGQVLGKLKSLSKRTWLIIAGIVAFLGLTLLFYGYFQTRSELMSLNSGEAAQAEIKRITDKISLHFDLPNETPTIATVDSTDNLKGQAFFANAQVGDKVLVFAQAGRALLYRPATNKVIEYALIDTSAQSIAP